MSAKNSGFGLRISKYLELAIRYQASDIHFVADHPPIYRIQGKLTQSDLPVIDAEQMDLILFELMSDRQKKAFELIPELDMSFQFNKDYYFRANIHREKGNVAATIRIMPGVVRTLQELGLPHVVKDLTQKVSGLILVVGRAGSGKTTTVTHMVDQINHDRPAKIITIEDPIEFIYKSEKSLVIQREVGMDTPSFASGLKYALRQDPDVVVIGEMRDLESISMALTTAETGHLVFATLHASDAIEAVSRIIDVYPGDKQNQIRVQLADNLTAVIGQQLLPQKDSTERVLATEVIVVNMAVRNMIRRNSSSEIRSQMESGREGMYTLEQCLSVLHKKGLVTEEIARQHAKHSRLLELG